MRIPASKLIKHTATVTATALSHSHSQSNSNSHSNKPFPFFLGEPTYLSGQTTKGKNKIEKKTQFNLNICSIADLGKARGCSTNSVVIRGLFRWGLSFMFSLNQQFGRTNRLVHQGRRGKFCCCGCWSYCGCGCGWGLLLWLLLCVLLGLMLVSAHFKKFSSHKVTIT